MSGRSHTPYSTCLDWIYDQNTNIERARYGKNKKSVADAVEEQKHKAKVIADYKKELDRVLEQTQSEDQKKHLIGAYEKLMDTSEKKINCLNTMLEISSLEEYCGDVSHEFDVRAVNMVDPDERAKMLAANKGGENTPGFLAPSSQDCVFAVQDNWKWITKLVECIQFHLKNASTYHQFFHDVDEASVWLLEDLKRLHTTFEITPLEGDYQGANKLQKELEELIIALKQWETKSNFMWETAIKVVPVHARTRGITEPTPVRAIADYESSTISVREGEDLLLLDNSKTNMWKVRNCRGQEEYIPALVCLIPGPTKDAVDAAVGLRLKLLAAWTNTLKRIGKRLIAFMLMVFKPVYAEDEINILKSIEDLDKADLLRILDFIENTLKVHWTGHEGFLALQERVLALRMILEESGDKPLEDASVCKALVVQVSILESLMGKYKDLWHDWEKYKVALESSQAPELMLICDKWEQLKYVSRDYFSKFWKTELPFNEEERTIAGLRTMTIGETKIEDSHLNNGIETTDGYQGRLGGSRRSLNFAEVDQIPNGHQMNGGDLINEEIISTQATSGLHSSPLMNASAQAKGNFGIGNGLTVSSSGEFVTKDGRSFGRMPNSSDYTRNSKGQYVLKDGTILDHDPMSGEYMVNEFGQFVSKDGRIIGPASDFDNNNSSSTWQTGYGIQEFFYINDKELLISVNNGNVVGRPPKANSRFGVKEDFIVNNSGEFMRRDGKMLARPIRKGDYSKNNRGQYIISSGRMLDHSPNSGEYMINEYGEFVTRQGYVVGKSLKGFDVDGSYMDLSGIDEDSVHEAIVAETVDSVNSAAMNGAFQMQSVGSESLLEESLDESVEMSETGLENYQAVSPEMIQAGQFGYASETKTAHAEEIRHQEQEENKTFIIRCVTDPRDNSQISLQQAIMNGIIHPENGTYMNPETNEVKPIPQAMTEGLIHVSFSSTKRSPIKKSSVGIIHLKTLREKLRPFKVVTAKNTKAHKFVSESEALEQGIIDENRITYTDIRTGKQVLLADAIQAKLVEVEYTGPEPEPEVVTQTYAVRAVVDTRAKKVVTFYEAVNRQIINRDTGSFRDTLTGKTMYIGDAIMRGFLKARKVDEDAIGLDIDPTNSLVIDKTESIKKKILKPLSVISAFKKAAAMSAKR